MMNSCTEKIDLDLDDTYARLVVEGTVTTDAKAHTIVLTTTTSYFYNQQTPRVSGATVKINDGYTDITLTENPTKPGFYETDPSYQGVVGRIYKLSIELASEINGHKNYDAECMLNNVAPLDSIRVELNDDYDELNYWDVQCYALDPANRVDFYMFNVYKNNILMSDTLDEIFLTDDELFNGNYTNGIGAQNLEEDDAEIGDTITLEMCGITKEYLEFLYELQTETGFSIPLFSGPPANISSNISNGGLGFFAAYSVSRASTIID